EDAAANIAYEQARLTRWVLHEVFYAIATRQRARLEDALPELNRLLATAYRHLELSLAAPGRRAGSALTWHWQFTPDALESVVWPVVRASADLLTSPDAGRIRMCAGPDCGW